MESKFVRRTFRDSEMPYFYLLTAGLLAVCSLIPLLSGEMLGAVALLGIAAGFAYFGWPLKAVLLSESEVCFSGVLRRVVVNPKNLVKVRVVRSAVNSQHLSLHVRYRLPVGYRLANYSNKHVLAAIILEIIDRAPAGTASPEAISLLRHVAG